MSYHASPQKENKSRSVNRETGWKKKMSDIINDIPEKPRKNNYINGLESLGTNFSTSGTGNLSTNSKNSFTLNLISINNMKSKSREKSLNYSTFNGTVKSNTIQSKLRREIDLFR